MIFIFFSNSAKKLSPIFKFSTVLGAPFNNKILLVMGEFESPAFLEQQQRFAQVRYFLIINFIHK